MTPQDFSFLTDEEKKKLLYEKLKGGGFSPEQAPADEIESLATEQLRNRLKGEGDYAAQIEEARKSAEPGLMQKIGGVMYALGRGDIGDIQKMNAEREANAIAPIKMKYEMEGKNLDDAQKYAEGLRAKQKMEFDRQKYLAEEPSRQTDVDYKRALIQDMLQKRILDKQKMEQEKELAMIKAKKDAGLSLTPAQKKIDEEFGKKYQEDIVQGGTYSEQKVIDQLKGAKERMGKSDTVSGPIISMVPESIRKRFFPEGAAVKSDIEDVVQRSLKQILGAQFTEKEGERMMARAFDPALSEVENTKRLDRLITELDQMRNSKAEASAYFRDHGTLQGFVPKGGAGGKPDFSKMTDEELANYKP